MKYVVEVETSIRNVYGPIPSIVEARAIADKFLEREDVKRAWLRTLYDAPPIIVNGDPNQTTIQDHISDIADAIT